MDRSVLARKQLVELKSIASQLQMRGYQRLKKADLVDAIIRAASEGQGSEGNGQKEQAGGQTTPAADPGATSGATPAAASSNGRGADSAKGPEPRVRTRTRERTEEEREAEPATAAEGGGEEASGQEDRRGGERARQGREPAGSGARDRATQRDARPPDAGSPEARSPDAGPPDAQPPDARPQGGVTERSRGGDTGDAQDGGHSSRDDGGDAGDEDDEDGGRRRRRSRRERRRNKGGTAGGGTAGGGTAGGGSGGGSGGAGGGSSGGGSNASGGGQAPSAQPRPQRPAEDESAEVGETREGVLDILPEGYGFLRASGYLAGDRDVYVSQSQVRRAGLRRGDLVEGPIRQQRSSEKVPALHSVASVNGVKPDELGGLPARPEFKDMTPLFPDERLRLETPDGPISMRVVDLMAPVGKGQRGLIVSPPKAGKTTILKELGQAIVANNPECHLMVVLVDERPEEVTDMRRSVPGEIIASTFDRPADDHTSIAELAIERAKRMVELGGDVVILLDSITRLSRAYNLAAPASGRIMSGGVDSTALYPPKRFFGAARNIEGGGSLTIIATALIETGSKMDEVIFEEFKGTGNSELRLDRRLEQKRIFPAIDILASGTRREELLLDPDELAVIWKLRRVLHALEGPSALELLIDKMKSTKSNNQFLIQIQKSNLHS